MKKIFALLLIIVVYITILAGCNTPTDNTDTNKSSDVITTESETLDEALENTNPNGEPPVTYGKSVDSLYELSQMREIFYCTDKEKLESTLLHWGCYTAEELLPFLNAVDSASYIDILNGDITWVSYSESDIYSNKVLNVTTTAENGDWVRISYFLQIADGEDPMSWAIERASRKDAEILEPIESQDKRVSLISEARYKHPVYEGDCVEWLGTVDNIAAEILYYSTNIDDIKTEEVLNSLTITTIPKSDPIAPELIEQISEGMAYKEVKEIIGALRKDISTENIVFEYYLSDGRTAQIEFQKLNENDDLNDFTVKSITIE
jgi:hypothetical protein